MQKRNFILLIIGLVIVAILGFLYFSSRKNTPTTDNTSGSNNFFSQFNPFGPGKPTTPVVKPPVDVSGYIPPTDQTIINKLVKISSMPIAGFGIFTKERLKDVPVPTTPTTPTKTPTAPPTEFVKAVRYVDRATGNVYQTFADKIEERKFSTTIIPEVYDAYFGNNGSVVVMRYLKDGTEIIETFVGTIPKEVLGADTTASNEIKGYFLPENIKDISLSADASKIFYLFTVGQGNNSAVGVNLNLTTNGKTQIFNSPFTEWLSSWGGNKAITLTTKPSWNTQGYMYSIDPNSKGNQLTKVMGGVNGLTTLESPDGKLILYADNNLSANVYNISTGSTTPLGVRTIPEKCVWGSASDVIYCAVPKTIPGGQYPDDWYQGQVSFSDQIWKIDVKSGNTSMIIDPLTILGGEEIDGTKLAIDDTESYLFFVNKKDNFLWKFDLK